MRRLLVTLGLLAFLSACQGVDKELCKQGCWNHYELEYRANLEAELADLPVAERDAYRAEKLDALAKMKADPHHGPFEICLEMCTERGDEKTVKCYAEATSVEDLKACK